MQRAAPAELPESGVPLIVLRGKEVGHDHPKQGGSDYLQGMADLVVDDVEPSRRHYIRLYEREPFVYQQVRLWNWTKADAATASVRKQIDQEITPAEDSEAGPRRSRPSSANDRRDKRSRV